MKKYNITFNAIFDESVDLQILKDRIVSNYKLNESKIDKLFSGNKVIIKSNVDDNEALKFKKLFERKTGLVCNIEELNTNLNSQHKEHIENNKNKIIKQGKEHEEKHEQENHEYDTNNQEQKVNNTFNNNVGDEQVTTNNNSINILLKRTVQLCLLIFLIVIAIFFLILILKFSSCSYSVGLSVSYHQFAKVNNDGTLELIEDDAIFTRGETAAIVLYNVGIFAQDEEGLNWMDIDLKVSNEQGEIKLLKESLYGEKGKTDLENDIANSPYIFFNTEIFETGKYYVRISVYDKISGSWSVINDSFTLK